MSQLKRNNVKKCFSLLREFVVEAAAAESKKGTAILALDQLQKVIAGGEVNLNESSPVCLGRPILDRS